MKCTYRPLSASIAPCEALRRGRWSISPNGRLAPIRTHRSNHKSKSARESLLTKITVAKEIRSMMTPMKYDDDDSSAIRDRGTFCAIERHSDIISINSTGRSVEFRTVPFALSSVPICSLSFYASND